MADLSVVGLGPSEEALYRVLVDLPLLTLPDLETRMGAPPDAALDSLIRKGLVTRVPGTPGGFVAVPPDVALDGLITGYEENLNRARELRTTLVRRFREVHQSPDPSRLVEVIDGTENVRRCSLQLLRQSRRTVRACNAPPIGSGQHEREVLSRGVAYHSVLGPVAADDQARTLEGLVSLGADVRVSTEVTVSLLVYDRRFAVVPLRRARSSACSALLIHPSTLLEAMCALFDGVWVRARGTTGDHLDEPSAEDRKLLTLLASGATDATVAKQLALSDRTVHRRLRALMIRLGVSTRLQAGYEACRRGWL